MSQLSSERRFAYNLWTRYRLTLEEYNDLRRRQDDRCPVCGWDGKLVVDHDHSTGDIRGLLCLSCNTAIGQLRNNIVRIERLIAYLSKPAVLSGDELGDRPGRLVQYLRQRLATMEQAIAELDLRPAESGTPTSDSGFS